MFVYIRYKLVVVFCVNKVQSVYVCVREKDIPLVIDRMLQRSSEYAIVGSKVSLSPIQKCPP